MTREEAIETLRANYPDKCYELLRNAVDIAIEALKAEPVKHGAITLTYEEYGELCSYALADEQKHGEWITKPHKMMGECPCCSECGSFNPIRYNYCPNCGAKMMDEVKE